MDGLIYIGLGGLGLIFMAKWLRAEGFKAKYEQEVIAHAATVEKHEATIKAIDSCVTAWGRGFFMEIQGERVEIGWSREIAEWPDLLEVPNEQ